MNIDGGCHCGNITYEADVDPEQVIICHCTDCQSLSATAYRTVVFVPETNFRLLTGKLKIYVKTADSGNRRQQTFCADCGTHIYAAPAENSPGRILGLRAGSARQRAGLVPKKQYYCRSALGWVNELGSIPRES